jgi:hypothetical protein
MPTGIRQLGARGRREWVASIFLTVDNACPQHWLQFLLKRDNVGEAHKSHRFFETVELAEQDLCRIPRREIIIPASAYLASLLLGD